MHNRLEKLHKIVRRADDWLNTMTGQGDPNRDKTTYTRFAGGSRLHDTTADNLYHTNGTAGLICDALPELAMKNGFEIRIKTDDKTAQEKKNSENVIQAVLEKLGTEELYTESGVWANAFGAGGILIGAVDGSERASEAINLNGLKRIEYLRVIDRRYMFPLTYYGQEDGPKYGKAKTYMVTENVIGQGVGQEATEVHESRLIIFDGPRTSKTQQANNGGWNMSLLDRIYSVLRMYGVSWQTLDHMLTDGTQGVFRMKGLIDALAAEEEDTISKRLRMMDMGRSIVRGLILDADDESFESVQQNWSGIKEPMELMMYQLSSVCRIPQTILFGRSPAGMNATGDSDLEIWYSQGKQYQRKCLRPRLEYLAMLAVQCDEYGLNLDPKSISVHFQPLNQMSQTDEANLKKTTAETDVLYIDRGVVTADEVATSRFGGAEWSADTKINLEEREEEATPETQPPAPPENQEQ